MPYDRKSFVLFAHLQACIFTLLAILNGTLTLSLVSRDYEETRYQTFGLLKNRVIMVVHTESETVIRIISARKANKHEEEVYFTEVSD